MVRRIDLIPRSAKLLVVVSYDALALMLAFILSYAIRLGVDNVAFNVPELFIFLSILPGVCFSLSTVIAKIADFAAQPFDRFHLGG